MLNYSFNSLNKIVIQGWRNSVYFNNDLFLKYPLKCDIEKFQCCHFYKNAIQTCKIPNNYFS